MEVYPFPHYVLSRAGTLEQLGQARARVCVCDMATRIRKEASKRVSNACMMVRLRKTKDTAVQARSWQCAREHKSATSHYLAKAEAEKVMRGNLNPDR
jgi:hypothetical protein